ncbi:hypothetical protein A5868_001381 [Enterococcus sp. 12F9_DIV0723]|uniref:hypothetical protein n=1 Tax=Enterococcus sp. 12F9_DIV0723 TaxID=1834169 RepID=UPI000B64902F|nr:hypothetical protein [Enterococcus sp. 12F9_DIV0723]OUZ16460.1 hypothetical protein A5868_001381 [Enterococcus sp. 12F9_DIV0723]
MGILGSKTVSTVAKTSEIGLPMIILVPLIIVCALAGTVGLLWIIKKYINNKK